MRLGDAADMRIGFAFKSSGFLDADAEGVKLLRGDNVQQGFIRWGEKTKRWSSTALDGLEKYQLAENDVILAMDRPIVGDGLKMAWVQSQDLPSLLVQRVCRLRGIEGVSESSYLRYVLATPEFSAHIQAVTTGANIPHISGKDIAAYEFVLPKIEEQLRVVAVLSAYDGLIAANQRRIALLEEAARRLYREWFVHLRFPGHEAIRVVGGVPEGWERKPLTDVADFINGFAFKPAHLQEAGLPVVKIPELRDGITSKTPYNPGLIVPPRNHIDTGDVLFSWSATLLVSEWGEGPALLNQHLFKVIAKEELHRRLVRFAVEAAIPELVGQAVGATMQHIRRSALVAHSMLVPNTDTATAFAEQVDPMMDSVLTLRRQIRVLAEVRDALLPKLMSGQLDVSGIPLPQLEAA